MINQPRYCSNCKFANCTGIATYSCAIKGGTHRSDGTCKDHQYVTETRITRNSLKV